MNTINWLNIKPSIPELQKLTTTIVQPLAVDEVCQKLIQIIFESYPWKDRQDLIASFTPSKTYKIQEWIGLPIFDKQKNPPLVWQIAQITNVEDAENPVQGNFQVLTLNINDREFQLACDLPNEIFPDFSNYNYSPESLKLLADWVWVTYGNHLKITLENLIIEGKLSGKLTADIYFPSPIKSSIEITGNKDNPVSILGFIFGYLIKIQEIFIKFWNWLRTKNNE